MIVTFYFFLFLSLLLKRLKRQKYFHSHFRSFLVLLINH